MKPVAQQDNGKYITSQINEILDSASKVARKALAKVRPALLGKGMNISAFGRAGDQEVPRIRELDGAIKLIHRGKDSLVAIDIQLFQSMVSALQSLEEVHKLERERALAEGATEYDRLISRLSKTENRIGIQQVFAQSMDDINAAYQPGRTEGSD